MFGLFKKTAKAQLTPIEDFWAWVETYQTQIQADVRTLGAQNERLGIVIHDLGSRLKGIDPALVHEVGMTPDGQVEIVVSADGNKQAFPTILAVVKGAPEFPWLKVTPFRQRNPGVSLTMFGQDIGPEKVRYVSLNEGERLGIDLFVDCDLEGEQLGMVGFIMLDQTLGEYDVETAIGSIEFHKGCPPDAKLLSELPAEVDKRRPAQLH